MSFATSNITPSHSPPRKYRTPKFCLKLRLVTRLWRSVVNFRDSAIYLPACLPPFTLFSTRMSKVAAPPSLCFYACSFRLIEPRLCKRALIIRLLFRSWLSLFFFCTLSFCFFFAFSGAYFFFSLTPFSSFFLSPYPPIIASNSWPTLTLPFPPLVSYTHSLTAQFVSSLPG